MKTLISGRCRVLLGACLLSVAFQAQSITAAGQFFPVPIPTNLLNQDITSWTGGSVYSGKLSGAQSFSGVPFSMQTSATGMNVVWGTSTPVFSTKSGTTYSNTVTLGTNLVSPTKVYALINTAWGSAGKTVGSMTFNTSSGLSYTVSLVEGNNVRDHYYGTFVNTLSANYVTLNVIGQANTGAHLDMQGFALPGTFAGQLLTSIVFTSTGSDATGLPFLAGVTVDAAGIGIDHVRLTHTGSGVICAGSAVTVTACQSPDSNGTCTVSTVGVSGNLVAKNGAGAVVATQAFSIPAGSSSTTVTISDPTAETVTFSTTNLSATAVGASPYSCWDSAAGSASCSHVFSNAGFIFSGAANGSETSIPNQVAGTSSATYYLRAVKSGTTTGVCTAALTGVQTVNMAYMCNNPTTCAGSDLMSVNGGTATTIRRNNNGSITGYTGVSLTFDANGNAPLTLNYSDVGLVALYASKTVNSATLTGNSNSFVVKPYGFSISGIKRTSDGFANPAASNATGSKFVAAGETFSATVTSVSSTGSTTPNFGREVTPEGVTLSPGVVAPTGGSAGALTGTAVIPGVGFTNGVASVADLAWSEVGILALTPRVTDGDYLGAGPVTGAASANIGRFYPDHFTTTVTPGCSSSLAFTYSGQPFKVEVAALNTSGGTTTNYNSSGFSKAVTLSNTNAGAAGAFSGSISAGAFTAGVGSSTAPLFTFTSRQTVPSTIIVRAVDADGVSSAGWTEGGTLIRSGRLLLSGAYGSEFLPVRVPVLAQYWTSSGWQQNTADACSVITLPTRQDTGNGGLRFYAPPTTARNGLEPGEVIAQMNGLTAATATVSNGDARLVLRGASSSLVGPGAGNGGYLDVVGSKVTPSSTWLPASGDARVCFGTCGPRSTTIYVREVF
jgi:MSHA biogenesis protein MshQ